MASRSSIRRGLPWAAAVREMKKGRATRADVREERLRFKATSAIALSAWRGMSGRRYVVSIHPIREAAEIDAPGAVILGVRRDPDGRAVLLGVGHAGAVAEAAELAAADGANELHFHRLAVDDVERDAIVEDLVDLRDLPTNQDQSA